MYVLFYSRVILPMCCPCVGHARVDRSDDANAHPPSHMQLGAHPPSDMQLPGPCAMCGVRQKTITGDRMGATSKVDVPFRRCRRCKSKDYCSEKCQRAHWAQSHKSECLPPDEEVQKTLVISTSTRCTIPPFAVVFCYRIREFHVHTIHCIIWTN